MCYDPLRFSLCSSDLFSLDLFVTQPTHALLRQCTGWAFFLDRVKFLLAPSLLAHPCSAPAVQWVGFFFLDRVKFPLAPFLLAHPCPAPAVRWVGLFFLPRDWRSSGGGSNWVGCPPWLVTTHYGSLGLETNVSTRAKEINTRPSLTPFVPHTPLARQ